MGGGKGSSTTQVQVTPEQQRLLQAQTDFLTGTAFPAYSNTVGGARDAYNRTAGQAINAAQNAMNVSSAAGELQGSVGTGAYKGGVGGTSDVANYQQALGQGLTAGGAGGVANTANYQQALGQGLTAGAVGQLSSLFSPQYEQQQIQAALQPATEDVREQMNQQGALFGGAGGLGSARQALASQNLASLSQARLGNIAAQTAANVAGQRQQVGEALLGAGQTATGQAGSLYGGLLNAGQGATSAAQQGFGNLASLGQQGLSAAQQSAAANIGYAQAPQDIYSKYASVVFGIPQGNTTANFAGTQGSSTSGKSMGFKL